jgi:hypothetical protein
MVNFPDSAVSRLSRISRGQLMSTYNFNVTDRYFGQFWSNFGSTMSSRREIREKLPEFTVRTVKTDEFTKARRDLSIFRYPTSSQSRQRESVSIEGRDRRPVGRLFTRPPNRSHRYPSKKSPLWGEKRSHVREFTTEAVSRHSLLSAPSPMIRPLPAMSTPPPTEIWTDSGFFFQSGVIVAFNFVSPP